MLAIKSQLLQEDPEYGIARNKIVGFQIYMTLPVGHGDKADWQQRCMSVPQHLHNAPMQQLSYF